MKYGMYIDLDKCVACQACTIACKMENNCSEGSHWNRVVAVGPNGNYPKVKMTFVPTPCQHCENAPCVNVCPVQATYKRQDGIIMQDTQKCIGCKKCLEVCPYGVRFFNKVTPFVESADGIPAWDGVPAFVNPEVQVRPRQVVEKCTFCVHRIDKGIMVPACVEACPSQCMVFGDLDDPKSDINKHIEHKGTFQLKPDQKTNPKLYYRADSDR